jgi:hypothetical protein
VTSTPRSPSGSFENALARRVVCERLVELLEQRAAGGRIRQLLGRPDLRFRRLAQRARDLERRFRRWHEPGEFEVARTSIEDRGLDTTEYAALLAEARGLGVSITRG